MKRILAIGVGAALSASGLSFPLFPEITAHDINFGAFNAPDGGPEWSTNGLAPDTLTYTLSEAHHEVTAWWPAWPAPPPIPIFGGGGIFGGDFGLQVMFTGQDAPYVGPGGVIDVSLTGTGANPAGADLVIFGSIGGPGAVVLLWAVDLREVSLHGVSGRNAYVLEGIGVITGGLIAEQHNLIGSEGGMRGHLDFLDQPADWIPPLYDPLLDPREAQFRAGYSGETGVVPEPATLGVMALGLAFLAKRRKR